MSQVASSPQHPDQPAVTHQSFFQQPPISTSAIGQSHSTDRQTTWLPDIQINDAQNNILMLAERAEKQVSWMHCFASTFGRSKLEIEDKDLEDPRRVHLQKSMDATTANLFTIKATLQETAQGRDEESIAALFRTLKEICDFTHELADHAVHFLPPLVAPATPVCDDSDDYNDAVNLRLDLMSHLSLADVIRIVANCQRAHPTLREPAATHSGEVNPLQTAEQQEFDADLS